MKQKLVNSIFSSVAGKYDLMNDAMSLGMHRFWKKEMIKLLPNKSSSLLDLAAGSGDIAYQYLKCARDSKKAPAVTLCDINLEMLLMGRNKLIDRGYLSRINFVVGDGMFLPIKSNAFDYCTMAFGIRNIPDIVATLNEVYRVLKPGGKFICMEFSYPDHTIVSTLYDLYSFKIIPRMGKLIAGNQKAYEYLVDSIRQFPSKEKFLNMIKESGFISSSYQTLSFGVVAVHFGYKKAKSGI